MTLNTELLILWSALIIYVLGGCLAIYAAILGKRLDDYVLGFISLGLLVHTLAIGYRWVRLGHGPFLTMYEILSSNIWSLTLFFTLCYWRIPAIRPIAAGVMPVLFMMMAWMLLAHPGRGFFPPTYDTVWLYVHIGFGKVFLGAALVATGLSLAVLARRLPFRPLALSSLPDDRSLSELAFRFLALGLVFQTLMLVAGAVWAQDAWGRYWDWDPLETWSFITWIVLAFALHTRVTWRITPQLGSALIIMVFVLAFLTFFGVPFISMTPHKGAV